MSIVIEVTNKVETKQVARKVDGKIFQIPEQQCWIKLEGDEYPTKVVRSVGQGKQPLQAGRYQLAPSSFYVDKFGNLAIKSQFDVIPVAALADKKAA